MMLKLFVLGMIIVCLSRLVILFNVDFLVIMKLFIDNWDRVILVNIVWLVIVFVGV